MGSFVDYLDSRILLSFALSVVSRVEPPSQDHLEALIQLMDHMVYPLVREWDNSSQIRDHFADECVYGRYVDHVCPLFPWELIRILLLEHAAFHARMKGAALAVRNLGVLFHARGSLQPCYTGEDQFVVSRGVLRAGPPAKPLSALYYKAQSPSIGLKQLLSQTVA